MMARLRFGPFELRAEERHLLQDDRAVPLGSRAFDVLLALVERRDRVVTKEELLAAAWGGLVVEENNLTVQVSHLRKLLGHDSIITVTGRGYRFTPEVKAAPSAQPEAGVPRGNLPAVLQPLFGRDEDARQVSEACARRALVTICGPGGIGKTCLAGIVARQMAPQFDDGTWVAELAAVRDPALVAPTIALCLGLSLPGQGSPEKELATLLQPRASMLVIDNCEHVQAEVARIAHALLRLAPGVRILATSQEPLRVPGEHVHRLAPLAVPPPGEHLQAQAFGAVQLFVDRVRAHQGHAAFSPSEWADAAEICRQLDGIALAIELAAARVPLLGVAGVRSRLGDSLQLLSTSAQLTPSRHQTMRATLQWSYDLLPEQTQVVLRRLGVFTGGFSVEGAQRVAGDADGELHDVLDHLGVLVDRSLLIMQPGRRPWYRLLEPLREFALDRLEAAGETAAWQRRHAHATRDICKIAVQERDSAWLWAEMNNARAALSWAIATPGEGPVAVAIATNTAVVLATAGPVPEATNNLLRVQHLLDDATPSPVAARYWQWLGRFGIEGRWPTSRCIAALERAAGMFEAMSNWRHLHGCRRMIAEAYMRSGDLAAAQAQLQRAEGIETADGPPADRMRRLRIAGLVADAAGRPAEALRLVQHALDIAETHGIERYCLMLMTDVAWVHLRMGQPDEAAAQLRELLRRIEPSPREGLTRAYALAGRTAALVAGGRLAEARESAPRTIAALRGCGTLLARGDIFAWLAAASGHAHVAAQVLAATEEFHARGETRRDRISEHAREEAQRLVAAALTAAERDAWASQGRLVEEAVLAHLLGRAFGAPASDAH